MYMKFTHLWYVLYFNDLVYPILWWEYSLNTDEVAISWDNHSDLISLLINSENVSKETEKRTDQFNSVMHITSTIYKWQYVVMKVKERTFVCDIYFLSFLEEKLQILWP